MDAFYASIEQRERPELRGRPVIVGAQSARGVVAAASYEARAFGVRSAMPGFEARRLCPHGVFLAGRMDLYAQVSADVRAVFDEFTSDIEPLALDEAFLDVTGTVHLYESPRQLGAALKRRVRETTGLAVSVGIGPSKLVAKLACTLSKPDGLGYVAANESEQWLRPLPIRRLWGVGPVLEERLTALGLLTLGDVMDAPEVILRQAVGARTESFRRRAQGIDDTPVQSERLAKSIGEENTFATDVLDDATVGSALTAHAETVAHRLRRAGYRARTVVLKIKLGRSQGARLSRVRPTVADTPGAETTLGAKRGEASEPLYPVLTRSKTLAAPTNDGKRIRDAALALWRTAAISEPVRLLGVTASNLVEDGTAEQLDLFVSGRGRMQSVAGLQPGMNIERVSVGETMDAIVEKFGRGAIRRAVDDPEKVTISVSKRMDRVRRGTEE